MLTSRVLEPQAGRALQLWNDAAILFLATERGQLVRWNWQENTGQALHVFPNSWTCAEYSQQKEALICGDENGNLHRYFQRENRHNAAALKTHSGPVSALTLYNHLAASGGPDGTVRLTNLCSQKSTVVFQSLEAVTALQFSPQGDYLAGAFDSGILRVWKVSPVPEYSNDLPQTQWEWQMARHHLWIKALAIAPGGNALASGGYDGIVRLWGLKTGHEMHHFSMKHSIGALAFAPDNRTLAAASGNDVEWWDSWTGKTQGTFSCTQTVDALSFAGDGILTVASGREWSLWELG